MLVTLALAAVVLSQLPQCNEKSVRVHMEWRNLSDEQKQSYLGAIQCMKTPITGPDGKVQPSHLQRFAAAYQKAYTDGGLDKNPGILPTHRAFLALFDHEIRTSCRYTGPMPYWDVTQDRNNPTQSQVWTTFGNGVTKIKNPVMMTTSAINGYLNNRYELVNVYLLHWVTGQALTMIGGPISAGHPLFYLILRNSDRIWETWQALKDNNPKGYDGLMPDTKKQVTAADELNLGGLVDYQVKVSDVWSIPSDGFNGLMCYTYAQPLGQRILNGMRNPWGRN